MDKLADGCCSATRDISLNGRCAHQTKDPTTICATCRAASPSVTAWLAEQEAAARGRANDQRPNSSSEHWHRAQAAAYEAAHAYAIARPDASAPPAPTPHAWALELADAFERSGKTLFFPEQFPAGYPAGWDAAHRECAKDLRHAAKYPPAAAHAPSQPDAPDLAGQGEPVASVEQVVARLIIANPEKAQQAIQTPEKWGWFCWRIAQSGISYEVGKQHLYALLNAIAAPAPSRPAPPAGPNVAEVTNEDVEWLAREAIRQNNRTLARIAAALLVGRT